MPQCIPTTSWIMLWYQMTFQMASIFCLGDGIASKRHRSGKIAPTLSSLEAPHLLHHLVQHQPTVSLGDATTVRPHMGTSPLCSMAMPLQAHWVSGRAAVGSQGIHLLGRGLPTAH